jgi:hypothetical protein
LTQRTAASCRSVGVISSAIVTVDPWLVQPPVSRTRATPSVMLRCEKPLAPERRSRSPPAFSAVSGPANSRSMRPVPGVDGRTGRSLGVKKGGSLARKRFRSRNQTLRFTVGKAARRSMTTRLGCLSVNTWTRVRLASPIPYVVTDSKSPARTVVMTSGSANAVRPGTVDPWASCARAASKRTRRTARPAIRTGSPDASASRRST